MGTETSELDWVFEKGGSGGSDQVVLKWNKEGGGGYPETPMLWNCETSAKKIKWTGTGGSSSQKIKEIKFDINSCKEGWFFTKTCDIKLVSGSGLTWEENFKPTITYSAF